MSRSIFHVPHGTPYHVENSIRGIRYAAKHGYRAIDIDLQMTTDGRVVGTHWDRPMLHDGFRDPRKQLKPATLVRGMTFLEVTRLRGGSRLRPYRISGIERLLAECARRKIIAVLEPKNDSRFEDVRVWQHILKVAEDLGAEVRGYTLRTLGDGEARVKAMKAAGIPAHTIH